MNSSSPDELALVEGAQKLGFSLKGRDVNGLVTVERLRDGTSFKYQVLNTLEFTSSRKRMSVIVRDC